MLSFACFSTIVPNVMVNCFQWRIAGIGITVWCVKKYTEPDRKPYKTVKKYTEPDMVLTNGKPYNTVQMLLGDSQCSIVHYDTHYTSTQHSVKIIS